MGVCKKCHRAMSKKKLNYHEKDCHPTKEQIKNFSASNVNHPEGFKRMSKEAKAAVRAAIRREGEKKR